jgi:hypothetical protein
LAGVVLIFKCDDGDSGDDAEMLRSLGSQCPVGVFPRN